MDFDDVVYLLDQCRRGYVEASIELSPADEERGALVARFSGLLEGLTARPMSPGELWIPIRLSPEDNSPRGGLTLSRTLFQRAEECEDEPITLTIWQRGVKLTLDLFPPSELAPGEPGPAASPDDDIPF